MPVPLSKMMEGISVERRAAIKAGAAEIVRDNRLARLREAENLTQSELALRMGTTQANLSQIERKRDVKLSTLRNYVEGVGAKLEIIAKVGNRRIVLDVGHVAKAARVVSSDPVAGRYMASGKKASKGMPVRKRPAKKA